MGLISNADDEGRLPGNSMLVKSMIFPYDSYSVSKIDDWLQSLCKLHIIIRYKINEQTYIQVVNFLKHQTINRPTLSKIPEFSQCNDDSMIAHGELIDGSLPIEDKLKEEEDKRKENKYSSQEMFEIFWKEYPKKTAKADAIKAWGKINPDDSLFQIIMESLIKSKASKNWTKNNGEFIPYPATWLNGKRWEDEIKEEAEYDKYRAEEYRG